MAKNNLQKREKLFNLFSLNLNWVKEHPDVEFKPDFTDGCLCPLCMRVFFKNDIYEDAENPLTLEDIPPASLGGKPIALTCRECNSKSGHDLDAHLVNLLLDANSKAFLPHSESRTILENSGNKVNGKIQVKADGTLRFDVNSLHTNPTILEDFNKAFQEPRNIYNPLFYPNKLFGQQEYHQIELNIQFQRKFKERNAEIALLRIAYLIAYSTFGSAFLMTSSLYPIRQQILNPDQEVLPKAFFLKYAFEKEFEGISIITEPKEAQSYLVVFSLVTASRTFRFAVVLPGPGTNPHSLYSFLKEYLVSGDNSNSCNFTFETIPSFDFLKDKKHIFTSNAYWNHYTREDYKPNFQKNPITDATKEDS